MPAFHSTAAAARSTENCELRQPIWGETHLAFIDVQRAVALAGDSLSKKRAILDAADRFSPLIRCGEIALQDAVDGLCDVARNHGLLTEYIEAEIGHRLRGEIDGWRAPAAAYQANRGPDRTDAPTSLSDEEAWAQFDRKERARPSLTEHRQFLRELLEPAVSMHQAYLAIQEQPDTPRPTPQVTIEAILCAIRERGLAALEEPATQERLARCDADALKQITERITRMSEKGELPCP